MVFLGKPFETYVDKSGDCWEWQGHRTVQGYGRFRRKLAHREAWVKARGPIPDGLLVCHSCDNPACVNPDHLWLGTHRENMLDMIAKGRAKRPSNIGSRNGRAKLTETQVREIRALRGSMTQREIASRYGVSATAIQSIYKGAWAHA